MSTDLAGDLNATITEAVQARVSAAVMEALSGDEVIGKFVTAALMEPQPKDAYDRSRKGPTFLDKTLKTAFQKMTEAAVRDVLEEQSEYVRDEVRKAIRRRADGLADSIVSQLDKAVAGSYGVRVELNMPNPRD